MENNNEENKKNVEQIKKSIEKVDFDITFPSGEEINSKNLNKQNYEKAAQLQFLQTQIQDLSKYINEYNLKQDHYQLKIADLEQSYNEQKTAKPKTS
tara:strand:- start:359 stop:649 length:291 start_codon:yes stop_codon:yes gene_type:complete